MVPARSAITFPKKIPPFAKGGPNDVVTHVPGYGLSRQSRAIVAIRETHGTRVDGIDYFCLTGATLPSIPADPFVSAEICSDSGGIITRTKMRVYLEIRTRTKLFIKFIIFVDKLRKLVKF